MYVIDVKEYQILSIVRRQASRRAFAEGKERSKIDESEYY